MGRKAVSNESSPEIDKGNRDKLSIQLAARSKAWVFGRSLARIAGSNPAGGMDVSLVSAVCCQVEVSESA